MYDILSNMFLKKYLNMYFYVTQNYKNNKTSGNYRAQYTRNRVLTDNLDLHYTQSLEYRCCIDGIFDCTAN